MNVPWGRGPHPVCIVLAAAGGVPAFYGIIALSGEVVNGCEWLVMGVPLTPTLCVAR
jgi:hypothetical protein